MWKCGKKIRNHKGENTFSISVHSEFSLNLIGVKQNFRNSSANSDAVAAKWERPTETLLLLRNITRIQHASNKSSVPYCKETLCRWVVRIVAKICQFITFNRRIVNGFHAKITSVIRLTPFHHWLDAFEDGNWLWSSDDTSKSLHSPSKFDRAIISIPLFCLVWL